ncbi:MAG: ribbon-helix-helix domain-containing protein [Alphaproteobacteria bacterium]
MPASTRFDITMNERLAEDFDELAKSEGLSRAEIFKRAFATYRALKQEADKGAQIIIKEEGKMDRQLIAL